MVVYAYCCHSRLFRLDLVPFQWLIRPTSIAGDSCQVVYGQLPPGQLPNLTVALLS